VHVCVCVCVCVCGYVCVCAFVCVFTTAVASARRSAPVFFYFFLASFKHGHSAAEFKCCRPVVDLQLCSVLQCVAVCCSALQYTSSCWCKRSFQNLQSVAVRCSVVQCVAVRCSILVREVTSLESGQYVALYYCVLQCITVLYYSVSYHPQLT